jgi:hypothetical protein
VTEDITEARSTCNKRPRGVSIEYGMHGWGYIGEISYMNMDLDMDLDMDMDRVVDMDLHQFICVIESDVDIISGCRRRSRKHQCHSTERVPLLACLACLGGATVR